MYKAYQSTKPCANRYLQKKWDGSDYDKHLDSLSKIKASIDTTAPQTYMHMHLKPKKLQLEEERLAVIERDNRILLEKISNVMRTKGRVDNQNDYPFCSLNREKRQREMLRVVHENKQVIKRVLETEAEFNLPKLEREWQDTLKTMDMMAHYPKDWWLLSKVLSCLFVLFLCSSTSCFIFSESSNFCENQSGISFFPAFQSPLF